MRWWIVPGLLGLLATTWVFWGGVEQQPTTAEDPKLPGLELAGYRFHAQTFGDPQNPTVVVLHGGPGDDFSFQLPLKVLSDRYFVVFYDQRGTGLSPRVPDEQITLEHYLTDLDNIINHYGKGRPVYLIGHSWGGMLATAYVGRFPHKVDRLVLAAAGPLGQGDQDRLEAEFAALSGGLWWPGLGVYLRSMMVRAGDDRDDFIYGELGRLWLYHPDNRYHCPGGPPPHSAFRSGARVGSQLLSRIRAEGGPEGISILRRGVERFEPEVLFLVGACDGWLGQSLQAKQRLYFRKSRLVVVEGVGHMMFLENIEAVQQQIRAYLR
ncbi:MAG: alpha/beta hydrolase [Meiothermus sp.]|nr:alpha/beta hydrolase [Meiothermus sp.]